MVSWRATLYDANIQQRPLWRWLVISPTLGIAIP